MMRKSAFTLLLTITALIGCHKDSPSQKILDGLPLANAPLAVVPAQAMQQDLILKTTVLTPVITNLNRLSQNLPQAGLSGPDGSQSYSFHRDEKHFGSATFTIQFRSDVNAPVDPFTVASTSVTVKSVHITISNTGAGGLAGSQDLTLTLGTVGILTGPYSLSGTSAFTGSSYSINFAVPAEVTATISGLINGTSNSVGLGPNSSPTNSSSVFGQEGDLNGRLTWEGQAAGIHINRDGSGYLTTTDSRILFQ